MLGSTGCEAAVDAAMSQRCGPHIERISQTVAEISERTVEQEGWCLEKTNDKFQLWKSRFIMAWVAVDSRATKNVGLGRSA